MLNYPQNYCIVNAVEIPPTHGQITHVDSLCTVTAIVLFSLVWAYYISITQPLSTAVKVGVKYVYVSPCPHALSLGL